MQLLVSDYDGTYNRGLTNIHLNNYYLNKWMKKDHKFMIATGRPFVSIIEEVKKHQIPYDYLNCLDGGIVFDNKDNILSARYIPYNLYDELARFAVTEPTVNDFKMVTFFDVKRTVNKNEKVLEYDIHLPSGHEDLSYLVTKTKEFLRNYLKDLDIFSLDFGSDDKCFIVIRPVGITKVTGIKVVQGIYELSKDNIYAIGDNVNDLEMIYAYEGYRIKGTLPYEYEVPEIKNVRDIIKSKIKEG